MRQAVLVEIDQASFDATMEELERQRFDRDDEYQPVPMEGDTVVVRGWTEPSHIEELKHLPGVSSVAPDPQATPL